MIGLKRDQQSKWVNAVATGIFFACLIAGPMAFAQSKAQPKAPAGPKKAATAQKPTGSSKNIEFDDGLVEGVNKNPADYASRATKWKEKKDHLYRKVIPFDREIEETLKEARYSQ